MKDKSIVRIYKKLLNYFGRQNWWPAKTKLEVIVGAVLTQNTAWPNVEKAIFNLKRKKLLSIDKLSKVKQNRLALLIKPAGYFNLKAKRLKNTIDFIQKYYQGELSNMQRISTLTLKNELLGINGIGPETADSILLYALNKPIFVIDAYTKRIFTRLNKVHLNYSYDDLQNFFMKNFKKNARLFNEYHALIVRLGKDYCKKNKPNCKECPIRDEH
ncbi:MAG: hypothetical protein ABIA97_05985 [Candidatus Omnitrophota bacterium]